MLLHLQGAVSGSVQASDRLMKELREIYRSQSYKSGEPQRSQDDLPPVIVSLLMLDDLYYMG